MKVYVLKNFYNVVLDIMFIDSRRKEHIHGVAREHLMAIYGWNQKDVDNLHIVMHEPELCSENGFLVQTLEEFRRERK